jgi:hypothetical protein
MEAAAVEEPENRIGDPFLEPCRLLGKTTGQVIVSGIGKSGIVAHKVASTLNSTGTPANFPHPGGALGRNLTLRVEDVVVADSYPALSEYALMHEAVMPIAEKKGTGGWNGHRRDIGSATVHRMEQGSGSVMALPVVDETGTTVGVTHLHYLLRSRTV